MHLTIPLAILLGLFTLAAARYSINIPPTLSPATGPITADYITPSLDQSDLDSPKLSHANASTFDWWHFDAIGIENPNASVAITFSNTGPEGYPLDIPANLTRPLPGSDNNNGTGVHSLWAHIWVTFEDGRRFSHVQAVDSARVHGSGDSSVAIWHGAGGWMGSEEGYEVEFVVGDVAAGVNVTGGISMERITSAHSRCSTASNFSSALDLGDSGLGWIAVMPDAIAMVDVTVNGEQLRFEGYGYHDKVWTSSPFTSSTKSLQRGRAHLGLYSVLWLSYTSESNPNQEVVSSFLARDGETVNAGCADGSVTIVPGREQTEGGLVSGFQVGMPGAQVSVATDIEERGGRGAHVRWNGRARGMVEGVDEEGGAIFERFEYSS